MEKTRKKGFRMPHIVFLIMGLMVFVSLMTYILPAGQLVADANGVNQYVSVERSPVNPLQIFPLIFEGTMNSSMVIALLFLIGASTEIIMETKAIDHLIDYLLYRLQDKGASILVPCVFIIFTFISAFATEGVVAVFPVAIMLVKRLKLDPMTATSLTALPFVVGFASGPISCYNAQALMDVPIYSGFGVRFLNLIMCTAIGAVFVTLYATKVHKDPMCSVMRGTAWRDDLNVGIVELEEKSLSVRDVIILVIFFAQYVLAVYLNLNVGMGLKALPAVMIPAGIICGILGRMDMDQIGDAFIKGVRNMSDICIIIGMAGAISLIMKNGMILDTIAYYASLPLQNLSAGFTSIGIAAIVAVLNIFIPSASAKGAAIIPIIKPIASSLGLAPQITVQAFQIGDGMMNGVSPFQGVTMGTLEMCKVDYRRWIKWYLPLCGIYYVVEFIFLYILTVIGWS